MGYIFDDREAAYSLSWHADSSSADWVNDFGHEQNNVCHLREPHFWRLFYITCLPRDIFRQGAPSLLSIPEISNDFLYFPMSLP